MASAPFGPKNVLKLAFFLPEHVETCFLQQWLECKTCDWDLSHRIRPQLFIEGITLSNR